MFNIGPQELLLILVVALIVVGPRRLPEIGRSIGKGLREIRKAQDEVRKTIQVNLEEEPAPRAATGTPAATDGGSEAPAEGAASAAGLAASAGAAATPVAEISKTLGRGLAELRKTRREIQRTFRVDLTEPPAQAPAAGRGASSAPASTVAGPTPAGSPAPEPADDGAPAPEDPPAE
jgi:Tat protein translocase TatB subunit